MNRWRDKIYRFMQGRYGMDELGRFMSYALLVCILLNVFLHSEIVNFLILAGLIFSYYRMMSRDYSHRYEENQKFLKLKYRFVSWKNQTFGGRGADKTVRIFKCPTCGQKVRVPRGKGKISIHCPKCGVDFIKRS
ncbi:MAG: hypothetical protein ACI4EH_10620 [Oliverpabstia sp.]